MEERKELICNGGYNRSVTRNEFLTGDYIPDSKAGFLRSVAIHTGRIIEGLRNDRKWYSEPFPSDFVDEHGSWAKAWDVVMTRHQRLKDAEKGQQAFLAFIKGRNLGIALKATQRFSVYLTQYQFLGWTYAHSYGLNTPDLAAFREQLDALCKLPIYLDYGVNNPNTGQNAVFFNVIGWHRVDFYIHCAGKMREVVHSHHDEIMERLSLACPNPIGFDEYEDQISQKVRYTMDW